MDMLLFHFSAPELQKAENPTRVDDDKLVLHISLLIVSQVKWKLPLNYNSLHCKLFTNCASWTWPVRFAPRLKPMQIFPDNWQICGGIFMIFGTWLGVGKNEVKVWLWTTCWLLAVLQQNFRFLYLIFCFFYSDIQWYIQYTVLLCRTKLKTALQTLTACL